MVVDPTESCPVKGYTHTLQPTTTPAHPRELWIFQLPATTTNASLSSSSMSDHLLAHLDGLCLPLDTLSSSTPIPLPGAPGYALFHVGSKTTSNDGHDNGNNGQTGGSEMTSFSLLLPNKSTRKYHAVKPTSLHCFKLAIHTDALLLSSTATSSSSKKGKKKATNEHDGQQLVFKDALVEKGRMIRDSVYVPPQPPVAMKMQLAATEAQGKNYLRNGGRGDGDGCPLPEKNMIPTHPLLQIMMRN